MHDFSMVTIHLLRRRDCICIQCVLVRVTIVILTVYVYQLVFNGSQTPANNQNYITTYVTTSIRGNSLKIYRTSTNTDSYFPHLNYLEKINSLPSVPVFYWKNHRKLDHYKNKTCAPLPYIFSIMYNNIYWQMLHASINSTFYFYGAYFDVRKNIDMNTAAVRILTLNNLLEPPETFCQIWFQERREPIIVRNSHYKYAWKRKWGNQRDGALQPYMMTCLLPRDVRHLVPAAVSVVRHPCDVATNMLRVQYDPIASPKDRKEFAVCVKWLYFPFKDISIRLVEWIELVRLLGADKVYFYRLHVHANIAKVLKYYSQIGFINVTPMLLPANLPNDPFLQEAFLKTEIIKKRQMEVMTYNDCLYRNMYRYKRLVLLDIDEVIVPMKDNNWTSLLQRVLRTDLPIHKSGTRILRPSSYYALNLYFLDSLKRFEREEDVPKEFHMLHHVYRVSKFNTKLKFIKAFHETDRVLLLHNHFPLECVGSPCRSLELETNVARLQHYRANCDAELRATCAEMVQFSMRDTTLWRWREPLVARALTALRALDLIPAELYRTPHSFSSYIGDAKEDKTKALYSKTL